MKRILSIILAVSMCSVTLFGCTSKDQSTSTSTSTNASSTETKGAASGEPVTLTYVNKLTSDDIPVYEDFFKKVTEDMKAKGYNITVKIESVQSGTYSEKLGLLLQSGTIPDLIYFQGGDYQFAMDQKILEDLTPYIEKSEDVKASMSEFNKERTKNYPYLLWLNPVSVAVPVVRGDFFNNTTSGKALVDDPTPDNYYAFMKELKEKNNTKEAFTAAGTIKDLDYIFDQAFGNTETWIKGSDGKYTYNRIAETEKKKLEYYAKLYKDGLLDNEFLTKKWDTKEEAFYKKEAAMMVGTQGKVIDLYNTRTVTENGDAAKLMVLPPAKGISQGFTVDVSKESRGYAISATSKHKKEAFALLEFLTTQQGQMLDKLGDENVNYKIENGKIKLLPEFANWYERFWGNTMNFKPEYPFDESTPFLSKPATDSLEFVTNFGKKDNAIILPADITPKMDACTQIYNEFAADVVTGKKSINDFDKYVKNFMDNGGKEIIDYVNTQLK